MLKSSLRMAIDKMKGEERQSTSSQNPKIARQKEKLKNPLPPIHILTFQRKEDCSDDVSGTIKAQKTSKHLFRAEGT